MKAWRKTNSGSYAVTFDPVPSAEIAVGLVNQAEPGADVVAFTPAFTASQEVRDLVVAANEACSNAHRYAYEGRKDGEILLELRLDAEQAEIWAAHRVGGRPDVALVRVDPGRRAVPGLRESR